MKRRKTKQRPRSVVATLLESAAKAALTFAIGQMLRGGIPAGGVVALLKK